MAVGLQTHALSSRVITNFDSDGPSVFCSARRVASQIRAGRVVINGTTDDPQAPWGGFKYSGVGREYGRYGIQAFVETRAILE